jgi:hypothetical protein
MGGCTAAVLTRVRVSASLPERYRRHRLVPASHLSYTHAWPRTVAGEAEGFASRGCIVPFPLFLLTSFLRATLKP